MAQNARRAWAGRGGRRGAGAGGGPRPLPADGRPLPTDAATPFGCAPRDATRTIDPMTHPPTRWPYGPGNVAKNAAFLRLPD